MAGEQHNWDEVLRTTIYMEKRHIAKLDESAERAGCSRQWMLRLILDQVLSPERSIDVTPTRISL